MNEGQCYGNKLDFSKAIFREQTWCLRGDVSGANITSAGDILGVNLMFERRCFGSKQDLSKVICREATWYLKDNVSGASMTSAR